MVGAYSTPDDLRIAVTQILITAYSAAAYAYLLMSAQKTTRDLSSAAGDLPNYDFFVDTGRQASVVAFTFDWRIGLLDRRNIRYQCHDARPGQSLGLAGLELRRLLAPGDNRIFRLVDGLLLLCDRYRVRPTLSNVGQNTVSGSFEFASISAAGASGID